MLVNSIPEDAMPVVEIIRRDVPRPTRLPGFSIYFANIKCLRFNGCSCPMGLHKNSTSYTPTQPEAFLGDDLIMEERMRLGEPVESFAHWWDKQTDPKAAVDAVWGKE